MFGNSALGPSANIAMTRGTSLDDAAADEGFAALTSYQDVRNQTQSSDASPTVNRPAMPTNGSSGSASRSDSASPRTRTPQKEKKKDADEKKWSGDGWMDGWDGWMGECGGITMSAVRDQNATQIH